ncbi:MAG: ATP-binding protein [Clostridia bacterium]|jgi:two-component system phosphate regulon sensor histidine kinase PhoR|nr:ATP-binding protein [Clostridia bacterium]MCI2000855.1 ATP-binding protein [Clostridia bacterium]MCI2015353.1 ATP-binding protein [Clostridia bacterium]
MTKRIFRAIIAVAFAVIAANLVLILGVLYEYLSNQYLSELKNESIYVQEALDNFQGSYIDYFGSIKSELKNNTRITWIASDGTVLYDSVADAEKMENHSGREEVKEAFETGSGESSRYSATLAEKTVYYAVKLNDGTVLRLSGTHYSVFILLFSLIQPILIIVFITLGLSAFIAYRVSKKLVKPLDEIDLEHPEDADTYEELAPLLRRISQQNRQIANQMENLKQKQQEFKTITENMQEGLLIVDKKTEVIFHNTSALKLLKADNVENGQSVLTLNRSECFREVMSNAIEGRHDEKLMIFEGRYFQLMANPVYDNKEVVGAVIVILDVTEKEEREALRREFTANVSHELKTPLTSISGFAEIIKNGIATPDDIPHFADNIYKESQRLITLVGDIIKLSQLDENEGIKQKTKTDLLGIVDTCISHLKQEAEKKKISIELRAEKVCINGVPQILDEMIYNIMDNAIKYNKNNGKIFISLTENNKTVDLSVKDTGVGIPAAEKERVFERFYRVDKSHSKQIGGTGLGLSIVKHGAIFHNATIELESEVEKGTEIIIHFPKYKETADYLRENN